MGPGHEGKDKRARAFANRVVQRYAYAKVTDELERKGYGVVRIVTHGLKGHACLVETKGLEEALGQVKTREKTREFYREETGTRTRVKNG